MSCSAHAQIAGCVAQGFSVDQEGAEAIWRGRNALAAGLHPPPHQPSLGGSASATPPQGGSDNGEQTGNILYTVVRERCLSRLIEVGETGEAVPALCGRDARAPRWFSSHVTPPQGGSDNGEQTGNILYTVVQERHRSRLIEVVEIGEAVPGLVRAGRPRSQVVFISCDSPSSGE